MANSVRNIVGVHVDKSDDESRFNYRTWQWCSNKSFSLNDWIQMPNGLTSQEKVDWQSEHWGTSEIGLEHYVELEDGALIEFYSAWCPPIFAMLKISEMLTKLTFTMKSIYCEQATSIGTDLEEDYVIRNGEVIRYISTDPNDEQW